MTFSIVSRLDMACVGAISGASSRTFQDWVEELASRLGFSDWAEMQKEWECFVTVR